MLRLSGAGFGHLALAGLLGEEARAAAKVTGAESEQPLASKQPHFAARAKRVIFLFMHGGPSQVDTFGYKPLLQRDHGKPLPFKRPPISLKWFDSIREKSMASFRNHYITPLSTLQR